jgi:pentatricopeptide repeat protein
MSSLLHECAERGDFLGAEQVVDQMRHQRLAPGPKAYHALIYSYVRGRNSQGALKAIRKAVNMKKGKCNTSEVCYAVMLARTERSTVLFIGTFRFLHCKLALGDSFSNEISEMFTNFLACQTSSVQESNRYPRVMLQSFSLSFSMAMSRQLKLCMRQTVVRVCRPPKAGQ